MRDGRRPSTPASRLLIDLTQIALSLILCFLAKRKTFNSLLLGEPEKDDFATIEGRHSGDATIPAGSRQFYALGGVIGALFAIQAFTDEESAKMKNLTELHVMFPVCSLLLLVYLHLAFGRSVGLGSWIAVILQFCGLYMVKSAVSARFDQTITPSVLSFPIVSSVAFIASYYTLRRLDRSFVNFARFALVVFVAKLIFAATMSGTIGSTAQGALSNTFDFGAALLLVCECFRGVFMLMTLASHDVVLVSVLLTFANTWWLASSALFAHLFAFGVIGGCAIAVLGSYFYLQQVPKGDEVARESFKLARFLGITSFLIIVMLVSRTYQPVEQAKPAPSVQQLLRFEASHPNCRPRKEPASLRPLWESDYHEFDNVLLIVFFSHARYDVNLDFYQEVYSKYFPNIVFIGPENREDAGFRHSFDVVVNSYHSTEDMTVWKLSGRMAHHMLYQVMSENDCGYDGYLWAPFDTFLNVPRLQQFDQTRFWYHSPWAQYVPNPALNAENKHAPPLAPSSPAPDPYPANPEDIRNYTWWWSSKEYGLDVCLPRIREVGGSADTVYIPHRHAKSFRETLAIFLETTCFLEIATPTTLHLVNPRHEPILFVDHYWIWYEPLNASFVRNQWADGFEVDTFHTYHWGDRTERGWEPHAGIVEDTRRVLAESAARQGIDWK
ncbi:hypothetical protein MVEN_00963800 [Mycena venus]|uniref:Uncharacterized protein n=1 Tax=Mycena venus TaxID=2733690 RepID=A0A8H6YE17_9AGAR|nr:hypothetical protein MVEN_00963800 [Mycena venus]